MYKWNSRQAGKIILSYTKTLGLRQEKLVLDRSTQVGRTSRLVLTPKWGFPVVHINTALPSFSILPYVKQPGEHWHSRAGPWQGCYRLGRPTSKLLWLLPEGVETKDDRTWKNFSIILFQQHKLKCWRRFSLSFCLNIFKVCYQGQHWGNTKAELWFPHSTSHPPGPSFYSWFGRKALHSVSSNTATGVFLNVINLLMIQISKQHVSTADDLWNARDSSLTSDKLVQTGGFAWISCSG